MVQQIDEAMALLSGQSCKTCRRGGAGKMIGSISTYINGKEWSTSTFCDGHKAVDNNYWCEEWINHG